MAFDFEDHSWTIFRSKHNPDLAQQLWLEGFKKICEGKRLYGPSIGTFCEIEYNKNKFEKYIDPLFKQKHPGIVGIAITPEYFPVNDKYHLAFWLDYQSYFGDNCKIFFDTYKNLNNASYPFIELRPSRIYNGKIPDRIIINDIEHSTADAFQTSIFPDLLAECYSSFDDLIKYAQSNKK